MRPGFELNILALIVGRKGSKRLPNKNIRDLGGKPLIAWTIEFAKRMHQISDILVSTDDDMILEIAKAYGVKTPWLRPKELATDDANSIDVCLHALNWYENNCSKVDGILLLQPTSPFRSIASISNGIKIFAENPSCSVVGVSEAHSHPLWSFRIFNKRLVPYAGDWGILMQRSQDLEPAYSVNGSFYLCSPARLRHERSFFGIDTLPIIMSGPGEAIDIDTENDWKIAETFLHINTDDE